MEKHFQKALVLNCKFYTYHTVTESYIGKAGKPVECTRTARVDDCKPVIHIFNLIKDVKDYQSEVLNDIIFLFVDIFL